MSFIAQKIAKMSEVYIGLSVGLVVTHVLRDWKLVYLD